jgi:acyl-CoA thioester hydrolase
VALRGGLRVDRLGRRAVTYGIAIFAEGDDAAAAHGHFVHVFVDRQTRAPVEMPAPLRAALERLA